MSTERPYKNGLPAELTRYCVRCRRKLKAEASMKAGMGPVCRKRTEQEAN